jgi:signal transduction histidine kinase
MDSAKADMSVLRKLPASGLPVNTDLATGAELAAVLAGADVGLALFDGELRLLACNPLYGVLCGYSVEETVAGASLPDLMRISLRRSRVAEDRIVETIRAAIDRLEPGSSYSFRYTTPSARTVEVRRRRLPSGTVVETVRELEVQPEGVDLNTQFAQIAEAARVRMMHALDVMADGFAIYDPQDRLVVYNRKYIDTSPHISDLIMPGASYVDLVRAKIDRGGVLLNGMSAADYLAQRLKHHANPDYPFEIQLADGRWILANEKRTADGSSVCTRSDITDMKRREFDLLRISQQLHAKNSQFDVALNNMIQGLCMFDADQRLIVFNRRYLELYGFSPDVVRPGITLAEIMRYSASLGNYTAEEAERAIEERRDRSKLRQRVTIKQRLKDGRIIAVMSEPMPDGGSIATYQDVTESERFAQQMQEHAKKLERSNRELQEFAYVASHDLQEPLRKIEAFGDRLARRHAKQLPEEGQMFIERMQNAAARLRRLISDLLSYSRVVSKASPFTKCNLSEILAGVVSDLQIRIEESKAEIVADPLPTIEADPTQMGQLFQNLIANSLKFRKADVAPQIRISARLNEFERVIGLPEPFVTITLEDNGIGFDNQYKEQIFKIFQRLHGRLEYEGTGIGLATCRKIVDRHRGSLDASGVPGQGATFTIEIPMKQPLAD